MTMARRLGLLLLVLSGGVSIFWGLSFGRAVMGGPVDFQAIYYGTRCLLQHHNPYNASELESVYRAEGGDHSSDTIEHHQTVTLYVNLPITFLFIAPFAMLPLGGAQLLWVVLSGGGLVLAALLMWQVGGRYSRGVSLFLISVLIANCELVFATGNTAGIVVDLCVVAVWCFLEGRFVPAGILCMAVSLAIKPHDAGLVWLFFLLAGGTYRKRALQAVFVTIVLGVFAFLWVSHVAPNWIEDWHANMMAISAHGGLNEPGPTSIAAHTLGRVISLQAVISVFSDDPRTYNWGTYLVCGALLLPWLVTTVRSRLSPARAWLAVAAIAPLTMLVTYHRIYDAKLLLLTVPACALLWASGGRIRWVALVLNTAAVVLNSDIPLTILGNLTQRLHLSTASLSGQILTVALDRPTSDILLVIGVFYLWVYVRGGAADARSGAKQEHDAG